MQSDLSDGLGELVHQGIVDPKRVCIVGASYGGYAALAGVTLQQGVYACAVSVAGLSDLGRMVSDDIADSGRDEMLMRNLKSMIGSGHDLKAISPITHAVNVAVPVMLIHGKDDTVVPFSQSTNMADALRHAGKAVEFVTLPGEDHWLSKSETRLMMLEAAVGFVTKHNPPDPAK
jgi:dipeptidyl aminopeptidase/acylaminoacyl peptidase